MDRVTKILNLIATHQKEQDFLLLLIAAKHDGVPIRKVCSTIYDKVLICAKRHKLSFDKLNSLIRNSPLHLYSYTNSKIIDRSEIGGSSRTTLITTEDDEHYVYKYDEVSMANESTFLTLTLARYVGVNAPLCIVIDAHIDEGDDEGDDVEKDGEYIIPNEKSVDFEYNTIQILEYIDGWKDFRIRDMHLMSSRDVVKQLAHIAAFDMYVGPSDLFLFHLRTIDNIIFKDDPDYTQMYIWNNPAINNGNLGMSEYLGEFNLWVTDIKFEYTDMIDDLQNVGSDPKVYSKLRFDARRKILDLRNDPEYIDTLVYNFAYYFELSKTEIDMFKLEFLRMFDKIHIDSRTITQLIEWIR